MLVSIVGHSFNAVGFCVHRSLWTIFSLAAFSPLILIVINFWWQYSLPLVHRTHNLLAAVLGLGVERFESSLGASVAIQQKTSCGSKKNEERIKHDDDALIDFPDEKKVFLAHLKLTKYFSFLPVPLQSPPALPTANRQPSRCMHRAATMIRWLAKHYRPFRIKVIHIRTMAASQIWR